MTERNLALLRSVSQLKEALGNRLKNSDQQPAVETLNQNPLQNCDPEAELQNSDQLSNSHQSNSKMLSEFLYKENDNLLNKNNTVHRDGEINTQNLSPKTKHLGPGEDVENDNLLYKENDNLLNRNNTNKDVEDGYRFSSDVKSADVLNEVRLILLRYLHGNYHFA